MKIYTVATIKIKPNLCGQKVIQLSFVTILRSDGTWSYPGQSSCNLVLIAHCK